MFPFLLLGLLCLLFFFWPVLASAALFLPFPREAVLILVILILPYLILLVSYSVLSWWTLRRNRSTSIRIGVAVSALICMLAGLWGFLTIRASMSSTASIGFLYLPLISAIGGVGGYVLGWSAAMIIQTLTMRRNTSGQRPHRKMWMLAGTLIACAALLAGYSLNRRGLLRRALSVSSSQELRALYTRAGSRRDLKLLESLARNPNIPQDILESLAADENEYVRMYVAHNDSTPNALLLRLRDDPSEIVSSSADLIWEEERSLPE